MKNLNLQEIAQVSGGKASLTEVVLGAEVGAALGVGAHLLGKATLTYGAAIGAGVVVGAIALYELASYADKTLNLG
jgi:hypothetical protein